MLLERYLLIVKKKKNVSCENGDASTLFGSGWLMLLGRYLLIVKNCFLGEWRWEGQSLLPLDVCFFESYLICQSSALLHSPPDSEFSLLVEKLHCPSGDSICISLELFWIGFMNLLYWLWEARKLSRWQETSFLRPEAELRSIVPILFVWLCLSVK